jgi:hypothetical protein
MTECTGEWCISPVASTIDVMFNSHVHYEVGTVYSPTFSRVKSVIRLTGIVVSCNKIVDELYRVTVTCQRDDVFFI